MKAGINLISTPGFSPVKAYGFFMSYVGANLLESYFEGRRQVINGVVTQQAVTKISIKAYKKLLSLDWMYQVEGVKVQIFNLERVRSSIERNMMMILSIFLPMFFEMFFASSLILWFCGPKYFLNLMIAVVLYVRFTLHNVKERKQYIYFQNLIDKKSNFAISGKC
jgi:ABC-type transport system involved in Fe-S cluster assembly fused permease/ATPase subunit